MATDSQYKITVKTTADLAGLEKTSEEIKQITKLTEAAAEKAVEASKKVTEGAENEEVSHHELKEAVHALGQEFGGLADVGLWLTPQLAALAAILMAVGKVKDSFQEMSKAILEAVTAARELQNTNIEAIDEAARNAAAAMAKYKEAEEGAAAAQAAGNQAVQDRLALYDAQIEAIQQVSAAEEKAFEEELAHRVTLGKMTQEQADKEKDLTRERLKGRQSDLQNQKEMQAVAEHERQLDAARARIPQEEAAREDAVNAAKPHRVNQKNLAREIDEQERVRKSQNEDLDKDRATLKELQTAHSPAQMGALALGGESTLNFETEKFQERVKNAKAIADATGEYIERLRDKAAAEKQAEEAAKAHADQIDRQLKQDQELDRTGDAKLSQERAIAAIHQDGRAKVNDAETRGNISREDATNVETQKRVRAGRGTPQEQQSFEDRQIRNSAAHESGPDAAIQRRLSLPIPATRLEHDPRAEIQGNGGHPLNHRLGNRRIAEPLEDFERAVEVME
jgi:hypothetical protein